MEQEGTSMDKLKGQLSKGNIIRAYWGYENIESGQPQCLLVLTWLSYQ